MKYSSSLLTALFTALAVMLSQSAMSAPLGVDPITGNSIINFYGRVVDQGGKGLPDATVTLKLFSGYWPAPAGADLKEETIVTKTDTTGNFNLLNVSGHGFDVVSIIKAGYKLSSKVNRAYGYNGSAATFTQNRPIVFKMWKEGKTEPLIGGNKLYGIPPDGQPVTIDFVQQTKKMGISPPGDIIVRIQRPATIRPRTKYDWSFSIEAIEGGIIHTDDEFLYQAPESGYQPKYKVTMSATNSPWHSQLNKQQFYFKSRDGRVYGVFIVDIIPQYNKTSAFNLHYAVNPSGSRNLER